jgi:hypothetical protein
MSKINLPIPPRGFELIRDRIFSILVDEIPNQSTIQADPSINANVFLERYIPFNKTELPAINVNMASGNFNNKKASDGVGSYNYNIDIYCAAKTDVTDFGDTKASLVMEKLAGICQYIFSDAQYRTLGFSFNVPFIVRVTVLDFNIKDPNTNGADGLSTVMGRINLEVMAAECNTPLSSIQLQESTTSVKVNDTEKGYKYDV